MVSEWEGEAKDQKEGNDILASACGRTRPLVAASVPAGGPPASEEPGEISTQGKEEPKKEKLRRAAQRRGPMSPRLIIPTGPQPVATAFTGWHRERRRKRREGRRRVQKEEVQWPMGVLAEVWP